VRRSFLSWMPKGTIRSGEALYVPNVHQGLLIIGLCAPCTVLFVLSAATQEASHMPYAVSWQLTQYIAERALPFDTVEPGSGFEDLSFRKSRGSLRLPDTGGRASSPSLATLCSRVRVSSPRGAGSRANATRVRYHLRRFGHNLG